MSRSFRFGLLVGAVTLFTAAPACAQGYFGADALCNYQQLADFDFDQVNPPAGLAAVRVNNPPNPYHSFAHAKGHAEQAGATRIQAAVQGFETAQPPPGPGDFTGLTSAGTVWNSTTWTPTSDTLPPGEDILAQVTFHVTGRMAIGHLSDDTNTPDVVEGIVPDPWDIYSQVEMSLTLVPEAKDPVTLFHEMATLDATNGFTAIGYWAPHFIPALLDGIETEAHWIDATLASTPWLVEVGVPIDIDIMMMATAFGKLPVGVVASADFWNTATYSLQALDATTMDPLPGVTFIPDIGASPNVQLTAIEPETNNQVRLTWMGPTNDVRILHSPTAEYADWSVIAWPDPGDTATVSVNPTNPVGCYLLRVGDP